MALGGVATGNMKAKEVAMVTGNMRYNGFISSATAYKITENNQLHGMLLIDLDGISSILAEITRITG